MFEGVDVVVDDGLDEGGVFEDGLQVEGVHGLELRVHLGEDVAELLGILLLTNVGEGILDVGHCPFVHYLHIMPTQLHQHLSIHPLLVHRLHPHIPHHLLPHLPHLTHKLTPQLIIR